MKIERLIPADGKFKITILSGNNGSGKSKILEDFAKTYGHYMYVEKYTNGIDRKKDILKYCEIYNNIVIDNIEIYLDSDTQEELLSDIFKINPDISIVCSTHSPFIIMHGWNDRIINIEDL